MQQRDIAILMEGIAPVLLGAIGKAMEPLALRLGVLEKRLDDLPAAVTAADWASLKQEQEDIREVVTGLPGLDGLVALVEKTVIAALPKVPTAEELVALVPVPANGRDGVDGKDGRDGDDGKSITADDVAPMVAELVAAGFAAAPVAKDGAPGRDGKDGIDGRSVSIDDVTPLIKDAVAASFAVMPVPKDGAPGRDGIDGRAGVDGKDGVSGKDGVGLAGALIDRAGELNLTLTDGTVVKLGVVAGRDGDCGKDGADGLGFDDIEIIDDGMSFTFRLQRGDHVKEWELSKPSLADMYKGIWREGPFKRGSVVTWAGSLWLAKADTEAKPETNEDWVLVTKRGRDGRDGELKAPREPAKVKLQ